MLHACPLMLKVACQALLSVSSNAMVRVSFVECSTRARCTVLAAQRECWTAAVHTASAADIAAGAGAAAVITAMPLLFDMPQREYSQCHIQNVWTSGGQAPCMYY